MPYNDKEISTQDGRPIALYLFEWGDTQWRYTSSDRPVVRQELVKNVMVSVTYVPIAISDGGMVQGVSSQNDFQVTCPATVPLVRLYRGSPPSETVWLTVRRQHMGEDDAPIYWKGNVWNVRRPSPAKAVIIAKPITASLKRTGLRLCWTRECPHFIYDSGCKVNPEAFRTNGIVAAINGVGVVVSVPAGGMKDEGYFLGGVAAWEASDEGTIERRMIESQTNRDDVSIGNEVTSGFSITVFGLVDFLKIGDPISLYPGCSRVPEVCEGKFNNIDNYGGFDKMPGASPFQNAIW